MLEAQNRNFWHTYCQYCQLDFSSEIKVLQLGSARILHSSDSLEPENSSSNSSLDSSQEETKFPWVTFTLVWFLVNKITLRF